MFQTPQQQRKWVASFSSTITPLQDNRDSWCDIGTQQ